MDCQARPLVAFATLAIAALLPQPIIACESMASHMAMGLGLSSLPDIGLDVCLQERDSGSGFANASEAFPFGLDNFRSAWTSTTPCVTASGAHDGHEGRVPKTFCVYSRSTFADGHGISVLTSTERARHLAQKPAFTQPETVRGVNRDIVSEMEKALVGGVDDQPPLRYRVEAMPGKGYGVVATQALQRGDRIMSSTAAILVDYEAYESMPEAQVQQLQAEAVAQLPQVLQQRFLNLSTHHTQVENHEARVARILAMNAFDIEADDGNENGFFVVFPEISRLNHDCRPNADYFFDYDTLTQHIHAVRPIAAGTEITVSYMDLVQPREQRLHKLQDTWGFRCQCSLCTQERTLTQASDSRIAQIETLRGDLQDYTTASRATPAMAELLISLYQQERMDSMIYEAYVYAAIEWNGAGEPWRALKYALLAVEYGLFSAGQHDSDVVEMQQLAKDPWAHWSWMLRTSRRMQWGRKGEGEGEEDETRS